MRHVVWFTAASFAILMSGCKRPHIYPVCFYTSPPPLSSFNANTVPGLERAFDRALGGHKSQGASITPDGRWLVARTTRAQNLQISRVWPRIGCIGDAVDSLSTKQERDCVQYIQDFVQNGAYMEFGFIRSANYDILNESRVKGTQVVCHDVK